MPNHDFKSNTQKSDQFGESQYSFEMVSVSRLIILGRASSRFRLKPTLIVVAWSVYTRDHAACAGCVFDAFFHSVLIAILCAPASARYTLSIIGFGTAE